MRSASRAPRSPKCCRSEHLAKAHSLSPGGKAEARFSHRRCAGFWVSQPRGIDQATSMTQGNESLQANGSNSVPTSSGDRYSVSKCKVAANQPASRKDASPVETTTGVGRDSGGDAGELQRVLTKSRSENNDLSCYRRDRNDECRQFDILKGSGIHTRIPGRASSVVTPKKKGTCEFSQVPSVEAAGIAPASRAASATASRGVACSALRVARALPFGSVVPIAAGRVSADSGRRRPFALRGRKMK